MNRKEIYRESEAVLADLAAAKELAEEDESFAAEVTLLVDRALELLAEAIKWL